MNHWTRAIAVLLLSVWCIFSSLNALQAAEANIPDGEIKKIKAAAPEKARVNPANPRKLLVFNLCRGYRHSAIPYGAKALEIMGRKTGAFEVIVSEEISMFEPEKLRQFDAVCMNNTSGELFLPKDLGKLSPDRQQAAKERDAMLRKSLHDFVSGGKGFIGIHAATACFYQWPEYGKMIGGYFVNHPWHENVTIKLDDPSHPLCTMFEGQSFQIIDEIYQFKAPYSRDTLRVLLSLDTSTLNMSKKGIQREDKDFAVTWIHSYGKGRAFYCSLGHRHEIFWNPKILRHYLDGVQFALGDLPADTTASKKLGQKGEGAER